MPQSNSASGLEIPENLYSAADLQLIGKKAAAYEKAMSTASSAGRLAVLCQAKARLEVAESHLSICLQTVAELMVWQVQIAEQVNNLAAGRPATAIEMPGLDAIAAGMQHGA